MSEISSLSNPDHPLVADAPRTCSVCGACLCLRKQVVNLAIGNTDEMQCLVCLAKANGTETPQDLLSSLLTYIKQRDCFNKEWQRYKDVTFCPDFKGCYPGRCFEMKDVKNG